MGAGVGRTTGVGVNHCKTGAGVGGTMGAGVVATGAGVVATGAGPLPNAMVKVTCMLEITDPPAPLSVYAVALTTCEPTPRFPQL